MTKQRRDSDQPASASTDLLMSVDDYIANVNMIAIAARNLAMMNSDTSRLALAASLRKFDFSLNPTRTPFKSAYGSAIAIDCPSTDSNLTFASCFEMAWHIVFSIVDRAGWRHLIGTRWTEIPPIPDDGRQPIHALSASLEQSVGEMKKAVDAESFGSLVISNEDSTSRTALPTPSGDSATRDGLIEEAAALPKWVYPKVSATGPKHWLTRLAKNEDLECIGRIKLDWLDARCGDLSTPGEFYLRKAKVDFDLFCRDEETHKKIQNLVSKHSPPKRKKNNRSE